MDIDLNTRDWCINRRRKQKVHFCDSIIAIILDKKENTELKEKVDIFESEITQSCPNILQTAAVHGDSQGRILE